MSNRLIDILDDEKKVDGMNADYHYKQSVVPRLEKLMELVYTEFVDDLISYLKENPHHRLTPSEMKKCNHLWTKYKT